MIAAEEVEMDPALLAYWARIRIRPVKWTLLPRSDEGGGFWVVAVIGQRCIWYNDIEDGFQDSRFDVFGTIAEEWCNQDELDMCLERRFSANDKNNSSNPIGLFRSHSRV
jgi:hypothetical protein